MTTATPSTLTRAEVRRFRDEGYLPGPYTLCGPAEMGAIRERVDREVLTTDPPFANEIPEHDRKVLRQQYRHFDKRVVYDLCSHPAVVGAISSILGRDLVLWRSLFFDKPPGGDGTKWHTDAKFWPMLDPEINVTAWIALTDTDPGNSCMQVIPGSHKVRAAHIGSDDYDAADWTFADTDQIDMSGAVPIPLEAGQFFLLDERILHGADRNLSADRRRLGLAVRVTIPYVRVYHDHEDLFASHKNMVISGENTVMLNDFTEPPSP
jgi:ectoine hydroxylase-related dioxygenase (phytanoyl-CoA dioxygenase family)